ncbi:hypothetical protein Tco_0729026 [Tanacetum coccineum]|uniref:Uncharacterized protein n=1 Tax=Tanacetum coccineum TaxID=301880 RepID=A0ABQ4YNM5_9ASTR
MPTTKESRKMSRDEILTGNKPRDGKWLEYTLLELVTRQDMLEPYHFATGATFIITMVHVLLNVNKDTSGSTAQTWRIKMEPKKLVRTLTLLRVDNGGKVEAKRFKFRIESYLITWFCWYPLKRVPPFVIEGYRVSVENRKEKEIVEGGGNAKSF